MNWQCTVFNLYHYNMYGHTADTIVAICMQVLPLISHDIMGSKTLIEYWQQIDYTERICMWVLRGQCKCHAQSFSSE